MKLTEITDYLDELFRVTTFGDLDTSFSAKIHYLDPLMRKAIEPTFRKRFNGLMIKGSDSVDRIVASCFLSDDFIEQLSRKKIHNCLAICHHMLDIDAGIPGEWNAKGFGAISHKSVEYILENNVSVYILHLPLDANGSQINTHLALCHQLALSPKNDLLTRPAFAMGYIASSSGDLLRRVEASFPQQLSYGNIPDNLAGKPIAVLAGMVSSISMLEEIIRTGSELLICGDVLLRQKTHRALEIDAWLAQSDYPILCLSHKRTEEPALVELIQHIQTNFPDTPVEFLEGAAQWK